MTRLEESKPTRRTVALLTDHRLEPRACDEIVVTLYPNAMIGFRPKRRRTEIQLPLSAAYDMALRAEAEAARKGKAKGKGKR